MVDEGQEKVDKDADGDSGHMNVEKDLMQLPYSVELLVQVP